MDIDKAKRDAQEQIDNALAEVDRLKTDAVRIKDENAEAIAGAEEEIERLQTSITDLAFDEDATKERVEKARAEALEAEQARDEIRQTVKDLTIGVESLEGEIKVKEERLESLEKSGAEKVRKVDAQLEDKKAELRGLEKAITETVAQYESEENRLRTALNKVKKEVREEEELLSQKQNEVAVALNEAKRCIKDAVAAEARQKEAEKEVAKAESSVTELRTETATLEGLKKTLKKEVETVDAELKPLLAKRIESINFMKELEYKEANLRKKYEDVGLEYK